MATMERTITLKVKMTGTMKTGLASRRRRRQRNPAEPKTASRKKPGKKKEAAASRGIERTRRAEYLAELHQRGAREECEHGDKYRRQAVTKLAELKVDFIFLSSPFGLCFSFFVI